MTLNNNNPKIGRHLKKKKFSYAYTVQSNYRIKYKRYGNINVHWSNRIFFFFFEKNVSDHYIPLYAAVIDKAVLQAIQRQNKKFNQ